jgi:excisionase family DNA binding protein
VNDRDLKALGEYFAKSMEPYLSELVATITASDPWLDTEKAAAYVSAKPRHLRDLAKAGQLPHGRYGNGKRAEYRFKRAALDEFLSSNGRRTDE